MALVCDIESAPTPAPEEAAAPDNPDLEDGEIEDDGEDDVPVEAPPPKEVEPPANNAPVVVLPKEKVDRDRPPRHDRSDRRRHEEKKKHMTEAEKSILHLRKRERMQREKWEKYRKEQIVEPPDDFAINIEKAIASVLNKKDKHSDEEKDDDKRGRKRKNRDKDNRQQKKQRKIDSPKSEEFDENEFLNVRGGSPNRTNNSEQEKKDNQQRSPSHSRSDDSYDSEYSSDRSKSDDRRDGRKRDYNKKNKNRNRDRNRKKSRERNNRAEQPQFKDAQGVCVFFLQGKCQKNDCPYSHEAVPPMKLELCKFYLKDCCAKGEKCSYMHSEFPCKFYHTGLVCLQAENCKFAHGKPLDEHRKQILFKHIETAPREILGGFPRMSREEALNKINQAQQNLMVLYGSGDKKDEKGGLIPSLFEINIPVPSELNSEDATSKPKPEKPPRNRPSRWQDPDPVDQVSQVQVPPPTSFPLNFNYGAHVVQDQDMRVNSNGDIDMRTLPPLHAAQIAPPQTGIPSIPEELSDATNFTQDIDIRNPNMLQFDTKDVDIRHQTIMTDPRLLLATKDVDIRQIPPVFDASDMVNKQQQQQQQMAQQEGGEDDDEEESQLHIDTGEIPEETENGGVPPPNLPKTQRELYMRIQSQQKTNLPEQQQQQESFEVEDSNINWYSDDDDEDENRLTIKVDNEEEKKEKEEEGEANVGGDIMSPPQVKPLDVVEKLGDLSKIDISAEVTKLLTSISQTASTSSPKEPPKVNRDPRQQAQQPILADPRQQRATTIAEQPKISIYEQGSIPPTMQQTSEEPRSPDDLIESDFRGRPDVDLRNLHLPFKGMLNYTPAKEIDASVNSHPPMVWKIQVVDIPRPDYTGLKLNVQDAEKTGDPRLRKIFRLSTEEKDSPASPKASPKATTTTRIDPRLKKIEESKQQQQSTEGVVLTYNQQLNILQSSAFFQSLTSNQKLLLNQELASRNEQNGFHDPVLNSVLSTLNLLPNQATAPTNPNNMGAALNILANVNKLNPTAAVAPPAAPMVPRQNLNLMNQMAQSMVQPGLLGAAPGIPNLPADFPMNFPGAPGDPRMNPPPFGNFPPPQDNNFGNFDDYYGPVQDNGYNGRDNRNFNNRDRRRGRNNFHNRNAGNRNFRNRNNRSNRSHTPP